MAASEYSGYWSKGMLALSSGLFASFGVICLQHLCDIVKGANMTGEPTTTTEGVGS